MREGGREGKRHRDIETERQRETERQTERGRERERASEIPYKLVKGNHIYHSHEGIWIET